MIKQIFSLWFSSLRGLLTGLLLLSFGLAGRSQNILNVTNYGAKGDCAQVWVKTTRNSSVVIFSNLLTTADIGKTIELFGVGSFTTPTNNQDLIAVITNVVNGTNIYISGDQPRVTANEVYCIYGTQNAPAFQAAVNAASGTNTVIKIPAGNYLMIPPMQYSNYIYNPNVHIRLDAGILINKGGIHFVGAGPEATILTADGAFKNQGYTCMRGGIFIVNGPVTNNYPLIWDSLTFDGGLQTGLTGSQGIQPANWADGAGWDGTSFAGLDNGVEPLNIFKEFVNCRFQHFRGEIIKGITGGAGKETILVTNCVFTDGNATAFNYNFAHTITGCTFSNMYQIEEFYLRWPTNAGSYFINNICTNIEHNFISLNGGTYYNQPYVISNNIFYQRGGNGIGTCPATSVTIVSNQFICNPKCYNICIVLGEAGYQGCSINSNIEISCNIFVAPSQVVEIAGGTSSTSPERVENVRVFGNTVTRTDSGVNVLMSYNWQTNVTFYSNDISGVTGGVVSFSSGQYGSQYALVGTNNNYWGHFFTSNGSINALSYGGGSRWKCSEPYYNKSLYTLCDSDSSQIPAGAQILITNATSNASAIPIYLNSALTRGPVILPYRKALCFYWSKSGWQTNSTLNQLLPPANFRSAP